MLLMKQIKNSGGKNNLALSLLCLDREIRYVLPAGALLRCPVVWPVLERGERIFLRH